MDKLKWTRVSKGDCWPASGLFLVRVAVSGGVGVIVIAGVKGDVISPSSVVAIAGPIDIAEPDPELELPEGWRVKWDGPTVMPYCASVVKDEKAAWIASSSSTPWISYTTHEVSVASHRDRARCVRAVNAAVKALEEERSG